MSRPDRTVGFLAVALLAALPARADRLALAGMELGREGWHAYLGSVLRPDPASPWRGRIWIDGTRYEYDRNGTIVAARATGLEAALGLGGAAGDAWWAAYLGPRYERTELSPDDPANRSRGSRLHAKLQAEAERGLGGAWRLSAGAAYILGAEKYWLRGRLTRPLAARSHVGMELLRHGGRDYTATQAGGLYALPVGAGSSVLLKGGLRHDKNRGTGGYAGVEFTMPY
jgi:hypothetical protein